MSDHTHSSSKRSNDLTTCHLDSSSSVMEEETFNRFLALERKRTERSKRPFVLMLLSIADDGNGLIEKNTLVPCSFQKGHRCARVV